MSRYASNARATPSKNNNASNTKIRRRNCARVELALPNNGFAIRNARRKRLAKIEKMLRLAAHLAQFGQRVRRRGFGFIAGMHLARASQIFFIGRLHLAQRSLFVGGSKEPGRLLVQPLVQFAARGELFPGGGIMVDSVAKTDIIDFPQRILELLGDAETFRVHRVKLRAN